MKQVLKWFLIVAFFVIPAAAQQTSDDVSPTKDDIEQLFATMHVREQTVNMMDLLFKQEKQMVHDALRKKSPAMTQDDLNRIDSMMEQTLKGMDINGLIDDMIPVYQRHLSKADVSAMAAFYQTPTGQKLLREQPQMTAEAMRASQPRMEKMIANVMDQAQKMAQERSAGQK
jgi:uncharacterized protein